MWDWGDWYMWSGAGMSEVRRRVQYPRSVRDGQTYFAPLRSCMGAIPLTLLILAHFLQVTELLFASVSTMCKKERQ